nr:MAG TPA: hypothetical protein [Crassvirales sp.]
MIKTYVNNDGIEFKGLQYTGKNLGEFHNVMNDPDNELGIFVPLGSHNVVLEDQDGLFLTFHNRHIELNKGDHFLYSKDTCIFGVFNNSELKEDFEQVK